MFLTVTPSSPALTPFVAYLGYLEAPFGFARERVLPSGGMQLLVNLDVDEFRSYHGEEVRRVPGAALQGPGTRATVIDTAQQRAIAWVTFRSGGAYPFFAARPYEARDLLVGLDELWGRDGAVLRERLLTAPTPQARLRTLESVLLSRAVRPLDPEPAIRHAVHALERGAPVAAVTDRLGFTARRFGRLFTDHLGLTPKRFARVRRFQRLLESAARERSVDWARLAAEHGYYDQAHLIHDFRDLSGLTPTQYRPRSPHELNHVPL